MANDNETLTYRIRVLAENLSNFRKTAQAAEEVNTSMAKTKKLADQLNASSRKLEGARNREADAAGRLRVAEQRLQDLRGKSNQSLGALAAAEERVASARRRSATATADANRLESEFKKLADRALTKNSAQSGQDAGRSWTKGFLGFFKGNEAANNVEKGGTIIGRSFGSGIGSGLEAVLGTESGPAILAGLLAVVEIVAPAIGAVLAGGIVTAFGAGLATLGVVFAAKANWVRDKWQSVLAQMGADMQLFSRPFESVLAHAADVASSTFNRFGPEIQKSFAEMAPVVAHFVDDIGHALGQLVPAVHPLTVAFDSVLRVLGPALNSMVKQLADGLIYLSNSVNRNPTGLADFVDEIGHLTKELLQIIGILNDANGAFERLTGGTSLVKVVMEGLIGIVDAIAFPLIAMAKYIQGVSDAMNALTHSTQLNAQGTADVVNKQGALLVSLQKTGAAAHGTVPPLKDVHDIAVENAKAAQAAKTAFEDWITQLFALQGASIAVARAEIGVREAIAKATADLKTNGRTLDENTAKGRANYSNLLDIADAAKTQTESIIRSGKAHGTLAQALVQSYKEAITTKANFIKLATQMTHNKTVAKQMADQMIAIPNVSRQAILRANITDLTRKLTNAKAQLADPKLNKDRIPQIKANIAALTAQLKKAQGQIDALKGKTVVISYTTSGVLGVKIAASTRGGGKVGGIGAAMGGPISGPGTSTSDSIPAMLSNNEYVVKASSAQSYGPSAMASVNAGTATIIPGYASGGPVVNIRSQMPFSNAAAFEKFASSNFPFMGAVGAAGAGVQRWRSVALAALAAAGEPASWIGSLLSRMQRESGGNPRAINLTDSNARAGTPSIGLMQTIGPTFAAYAGAYASRGIYDPFANIYAAIRYTVARYGSGPAGWNRPGGYKNGGWLMPGEMAYNETKRPEAVFNQQQLATMNRPVIVQLVLDGKVIQQSLLKLNRNKGYAGLGFGRGEGQR